MAYLSTNNFDDYFFSLVFLLITQTGKSFLLRIVYFYPTNKVFAGVYTYFSATLFCKKKEKLRHNHAFKILWMAMIQ